MLAFYSPIPGRRISAGFGLGVERYASRFFNGSLFQVGRKENHLELWGHGGNALGYSCFIWYLPEYGVSIGLISNREQYNEFYLWLFKDFWSVIKNNLEKTR